MNYPAFARIWFELNFLGKIDETDTDHRKKKVTLTQMN